MSQMACERFLCKCRPQGCSKSVRLPLRCDRPTIEACWPNPPAPLSPSPGAQLYSGKTYVPWSLRGNCLKQFGLAQLSSLPARWPAMAFLIALLGLPASVGRRGLLWNDGSSIQPTRARYHDPGHGATILVTAPKKESNDQCKYLKTRTFNIRVN